mmetsp:Transcript_29100/g.74764  ORF Transcript_29100/g.74764 Transcript_29100/m.74764 type:complete len:192 (+) Transcript_29100:112-687(+)
MERQLRHDHPLDYSDQHKKDSLPDFLPADEGGNGQWEKKYKDDARRFTSDYRRKLLTNPSEYENSDVGHIFSVGNGGSNTVGNVMMQDKAYNRTVGKNGDHLNAALAGYKKTHVAFRESKQYGNLGNSEYADRTSADIVDQGKAAWRSVGVLTKMGGGIDRRCKAYRRNEVWEENGRIVGLDKKVREMRKQ